MTIFDFIDMLGGLALFLFGMDVLGEGLKASASGKMETLLEKLTSNKWKAALLGAGVTAIIQSSGATVVMVVGLVNSGIMSLEQSVGVTIGANVGTTITAWLLSLTMVSGDNILISLVKPDNFAPILCLVGVAMLMMAKKDRTRNAAKILVGFCVLMIGMGMMSGAFSGLKDDPNFTGLMTAFAKNPLLGLIAGLVVTVILQSSSASIGILQSMSMSGSLTFGAMFPALLGANVGSAITGLLGAIGAKRSAQRAAWLQMLYCVIKAVLFLIVFYALNAVIHFGFMENAVHPVLIAMIHTGFNIVAMVCLVTFSDYLVKVVTRFLPVLPEEMEASHKITILDEHFFHSPSFALEQAKTATNDMAGFAKEALGKAMSLIVSYDEDVANEVNDLEMKVDDYEDQLGSYMVKLSKFPMTNADSHTLSILLHNINDLELITDHALNIMQAAQQLDEKGLTFSQKAKDEIAVYSAAVKSIMDMTVEAFHYNDLALAKRVEPLEEVIDGLNAEEKKRHVRRLRKGKCTVEAGFLLSDITTDFERIADHCSNVAVDLLQVNEDGFDTHEYLLKEVTEDSEEFKDQVRVFEQKFMFPSVKQDDEIETLEMIAAKKGGKKQASLSVSGKAESNKADKAQKKAEKAQEKAEKAAAKAAKKAAKAQRAAEEAARAASENA